MRRSRLRPSELERRRRIAAAVFVRDGACVLENVVGDCHGVLTYHHLLKASQGGKYTLANGKALCAFHNGWVEDHPAKAEELGLVVHPWEVP